MPPFFFQKGSKWSWGHHVLEFSKAQVNTLSLVTHNAYVEPERATQVGLPDF